MHVSIALGTSNLVVTSKRILGLVLLAIKYVMIQR